MKSICRFLVSLGLSLPCSYAQISDSEAKSISLQWREARDSAYNGSSKVEDVIRAAERYRRLLGEEPTNRLIRNIQEKGQEETIDYVTALAWRNAGDYPKAYDSLVAQARDDGKGFLQNTRSPDYFAIGVFNLQSEIMEHTGEAAPIPGALYETFLVPGPARKPRFVFLFQPKDNEERGMVVEGMAPGEERRAIILTGKDETTGRFRKVDDAQVIVRPGNFTVKSNEANGVASLRMTGVTKFLEFVGTVSHVVRESPTDHLVLKVGDGKIQQPVEALGIQTTPRSTPAISGEVPPPPPPAEKVKPPETRSQPSTDLKPLSATNVSFRLPLWSLGGIIAVVIVIFLAAKRKG